MRSCFWLLPLIFFGASALAAPPLERGVALHGPMTWAGAIEDDMGNKHYIRPLYSNPRFDVPTPLLTKIKAAGFDFIRLSVDPGPFIALSGKEREALDMRLKDVIATIRRAQLDVIIDLHPIAMIHNYNHSSLESSRRFPDYVRMVKEMARLLASVDQNHIALELMNEPQSGYRNASDWQEKAHELYYAAREGAPDLTLIMTGGKGGGLDGLLALDPSIFDKNVLYSFHYYLPYIFTHQAVEGDDNNIPSLARRYITELPYPPTPEGFNAAYEAFVENMGSSPYPQDKKASVLAAGKQQLTHYYSQKFPEALEQDFTRVAEWAARYDIAPERIFLGEFGATQAGNGITGATPADRARWLSDVRQAAEALKFRWSFWALCCAKESHGMVLVSLKDARELDEQTLTALGMKK